MTLLLLIQDLCGKLGLPVPNAVMTATETSMVQLRALSQEVLRSLRQYEWQQQKVRKTWVSVATESQGTLVSLFGSEYRRLITGTVYNDSQQRPIFGPVGDTNWQVLKSSTPAGPVEQCRIEGGELKVLPVMTAGENCSAYVLTNYGCLAVNGTTYRERFAADDDSPLFPDEVFLADLEWRWLKQKGEAWSAAFEESQRMISSNINKDNHLPTFSLDRGSQQLTPGLFIPAGSWDV